MDFAYGLNVYGVHYPLDVIGGRILATYVIAQTLAGNPLYPAATVTPANLASLSQDMQAYLGWSAAVRRTRRPARQCRRLRRRRRDPHARPPTPRRRRTTPSS